MYILSLTKSILGYTFISVKFEVYKISSEVNKGGAHDDANATGRQAGKAWGWLVGAIRSGRLPRRAGRWTLALHLPELSMEKDRHMQTYPGSQEGGVDGMKRNGDPGRLREQSTGGVAGESTCLTRENQTLSV